MGGATGFGGTGSGGTATAIIRATGGMPPVDEEFETCVGLEHEQETTGGLLDIYFVFDRTASMGRDCDYRVGQSPPRNSKACFATYAFSDYLLNVVPAAETRLAFQFMSLANNDCNGTPYATPRVGLTRLPLTEDHAIIQAVSAEQFQGGFGTHIEGALRGMASFTAAHLTAGREMIGVLMTDGDPNGCDENVSRLSRLIEDHRAATGIRTFIIGMEGATDANLESFGRAGGAEPHDDWCGDGPKPCRYWNVGDGAGTAISSALQAIIRQASPLPCAYDMGNLEPPAGERLNFDKVNVVLKDEKLIGKKIGRVANLTACPSAESAWYYDDPNAPKTIHLCPDTCEEVSNAPEGSSVNVVVGCEDTLVVK